MVEQFKIEFDEDFFVTNFDEKKDRNNRNLFSLYRINNYNGNIKELVDFYTENQFFFNLPTKLHYRLEIGEAWTYFYIDFANATAQIGFQTPDQLLYEQLFLNYDLTAFRAQDAQERIGIKRMQEMFERIKKLRIPIEVIPNELYEQFLSQSNIRNHKLSKTKVK